MSGKLGLFLLQQINRANSEGEVFFSIAMIADGSCQVDFLIGY
jgi:hypothetical protein